LENVYFIETTKGFWDCPRHTTFLERSLGLFSALVGRGTVVTIGMLWFWVVCLSLSLPDTLFPNTPTNRPLASQATAPKT